MIVALGDRCRAPRLNLLTVAVPSRAAEITAFLYNAPSDSLTWRYPYAKANEKVETPSILVILGRGFEDGECRLSYSVEGRRQSLLGESRDVRIENHMLSTEVKLKSRIPTAEVVRWELQNSSGARLGGTAELKGARFRGRVVYRDPQINPARQSAYISLMGGGFGAPGEITIPVDDDGRFDALVPARVYKAVNVNSTGYAYNSLERWAWEYDLTRDREDEFVLGRMELYSIHAFEIIGGPPTLLIAFRPSALSRVRQFDADGDGALNGAEMTAIAEALKKSGDAIAPELKPESIRVWVDGRPYPVVSLTKVPEFDGNGVWQVQYLIQIYPEKRLTAEERHEIKLEVESEEVLNGSRVKDWGQGSVGFWRPLF